jgi:hypothetical protein
MAESAEMEPAAEAAPKMEEMRARASFMLLLCLIRCVAAGEKRY